MCEIATLRMAQEAGLLSLPDKLLTRIALRTNDQRPGSEPFKDWARAALTCKRLWELQLVFDPTIRKYEGKASRFSLFTVRAPISQLELS